MFLSFLCLFISYFRTRNKVSLRASYILLCLFFLFQVMIYIINFIYFIFDNMIITLVFSHYFFWCSHFVEVCLVNVFQNSAAIFFFFYYYFFFIIAATIYSFALFSFLFVFSLDQLWITNRKKHCQNFIFSFIFTYFISVLLIRIYIYSFQVSSFIYLSHTRLYRDCITSSEMWIRSAPWTVQIL